MLSLNNELESCWRQKLTKKKKLLFSLWSNWFGKYLNKYPPQGRWTALDIYLDASRLGIYNHHYSPPPQGIVVCYIMEKVAYMLITIHYDRIF